MSIDDRRRHSPASSQEWLLLETLDRRRPTVVTSGSRPKSRIPLTRFLRNRTDIAKATGLVEETTRTARPGIEQIAADRYAVAEPLIADTGCVHAVWLHISRLGETMTGVRPDVRTLTWNIDEATVQLSPSRVGTHPDTTISTAEFTTDLNFGNSLFDLFRFVLTDECSARVRTFTATTSDGALGYTALRVFFAKHPDTTGTVLRGLICPDHQSTTTSASPDRVSGVIAQGLMRADERHAVVDLASLDVLYWVGEPDREITWQVRHRHSTLGRLHEEDLPLAHRLADAVRDSATMQGPVPLRFLTRAGVYCRYDVCATKISFGPDAHAALVTLRSATLAPEPE